MAGDQAVAPDSTAVRVALWRAMHVQADPAPHVLADEIGLRLAGPDDGWRDRGDMHPDGTRTFRASIVVRSRFVEDLVEEQAARGGRPVRAAGRGPGHVRPAAAGAGRPADRVRGRPARAASLETAALDRAGLRRPGRAAAGPGRLRNRRFLVGQAGRSRVRPRAACGGGIAGGQHVPDPRGEPGHAAPAGRAGAGFNRGHDVPAAAGAAGGGRTYRGAGSPRTARGRRVRRSSASSPPPRFRTWPGGRVRRRCGTCRRPS